MAFEFGSGTLIGKPASGDLAANPTPIQFGVLQDVSLDISYSLKELYGQKQFPEAVAKGKGKITGKAKFANIQGKIINDLFFGQTLSTGQTLLSRDQSGTVPGSPYILTPTVPGSGTFSKDQGVRYNSTGLPLTKVVAAPAVGQYSVNESTGAYTFAAADTTVVMLISYTYTLATGLSVTISNQLMGFGPVFELVLSEVYGGKQSNVKLYQCVSSKLTRATKNEDFLIPEFDFQAFADASGNVISFYDAE